MIFLEDTQVNLNLLNDVMENAMSQSQFRKYNSAIVTMNTQINQMIQNNEDLDLSLISLQNEINEYLRE